MIPTRMSNQKFRSKFGISGYTKLNIPKARYVPGKRRRKENRIPYSLDEYIREFEKLNNLVPTT